MLKIILILLGVVVVAYGVLCLVMYCIQDRLVFPIDGANARTPKIYPATLEPVSLTMKDGTVLEGNLSRGPKPGAPLLIAFAGNKQDATAFADFLTHWSGGLQVAVFSYRGYAHSQGHPSAAHILSDGLEIYDQLVQKLQPAAVEVMGVSLGSGVANYVAAQKPADGLLLVLPYDDLVKVSAESYPYLPVKQLARNEIPSIKWAPGIKAPVAVITAGADTVIRTPRSDALIARLPHVVDHTVIPDVDHGELLDDPRFGPWIEKWAKTLLEVHTQKTAASR